LRNQRKNGKKRQKMIRAWQLARSPKKELFASKRTDRTEPY